MILYELIDLLNTKLMLNSQEDWDNSGLQIGSYNKDIKKIIISLDLDEDVTNIAVDENADLIITHHPFIFRPLKSINVDSYDGKIIKKLIDNDISVYSMHTNLDTAGNGVSHVLAEKLGISNFEPLHINNRSCFLKLCVCVPVGYEAKIRDGLFEAGIGSMGDYKCCSYNINGTGTFYPKNDANPFIGDKNKINIVNETKIETIVNENDIGKAIEVIKKYHPYEEPAYDIIQLQNLKTVSGYGGIGYISEMPIIDYAKLIKQNLNYENLKLYCKTPDTIIRKVGFCGGSGADFISDAIIQEADVYVTGDIKYHEAQDALKRGMSVIDAGHFYTENCIIDSIYNCLSQSGEFEIRTYKSNTVTEIFV